MAALPEEKAFLEAKPLVRTVDSKKSLDLYSQLIDVPYMFFSEIPLFSVTESQSRLALGNSSALSQLASNMEDYCDWIIQNWDEKADLLYYPGPKAPNVNQISLEHDHDDSIANQIFSSSDGQEWLFNYFSNMRNGLQLLKNGLISSCEINAATVVASKHEGRSTVLSRCSELPVAGYKNVLTNTGYGHPTLFGPAPNSVLARFNTEFDRKGIVQAKAKAVDLKSQSSTRPKAKWTLANFVSSKKRSKSRSFQHFPAPSSSRVRGRGRNRGHSFGSRASQPKRGFFRGQAKNPKKRGKN